MFELEFLITADIKILKSMDFSDLDNDPFIDGFFRMSFQDEKIGTMGALIPGHYDYGLDNLLSKFGCVVEVTRHLIQHDYILLNDIESNYDWIEFKKENDKLKINILKDYDKKGDYIRYEKLSNYQPSHFREQLVSISDFVNEVESKTMKFTKELISINNKFKDSLILRELIV